MKSDSFVTSGNHKVFHIRISTCRTNPMLTQSWSQPHKHNTFLTSHKRTSFVYISLLIALRNCFSSKLRLKKYWEKNDWISLLKFPKIFSMLNFIDFRNWLYQAGSENKNTFSQQKKIGMKTISLGYLVLSDHSRTYSNKAIYTGLWKSHLRIYGIVYFNIYKAGLTHQHKQEHNTLAGAWDPTAIYSEFKQVIDDISFR